MGGQVDSDTVEEGVFKVVSCIDLNVKYGT